MRKFISITLFVLSGLFVASCTDNSGVRPEPIQEEWSIVLHGGAGGKSEMPAEDEEIFKIFLNEALVEGKTILENGGSALDAVQATVIYLEDCPLFNAGKGAVMTSDKRHELDACIMDGSNLMAGAVAGLTDVKNPIKAARLVMEKTPHVLLIGEGASHFAKEQGLEIVPNSYFTTEGRVKEIEKLLSERKQGSPMGTVGCVAIDKNGNIAAATSTGGMAGKKWGRVGDVPIVGASTIAHNGVVGVSSTGHGELWIRQSVAHDIYALMEYKGMTLKEAVHEVLWNKIDKMEGGTGGGVICIDATGDIVMDFTTKIMFRAWAKSSGDTGAAVNRTNPEEKKI
ncbi:MAG: isoaspartyl peptidase/L-asparaginase [Bacteroidales bacterium]|nr:isoaspartyl peptidase/L-asparaginase [Bacteroidales bacterium]MDD4670865.1 isoaspartyl peptidase/L-asparaginase [Bacteroidales bacterium]